MRDAFINTLIEEARQNKNIYLITPDLGFSVLEDFEKEFPERFLNVGISEANAVGIASGLALSGKIVYVYSIIPFVTMRPFEQIRVNLSYMNTNVRLVGVGAGVTYGALGATHHAIEDLAIMRSLPNMTVFSPSDPWEVECATRESVTHQGPMYFRLSKRGEPIISDVKSQFSIGRGNFIRRGEDLSILFTGNASDIALETYEALTSLHSLSANLISVHSLKPFDSLIIDEIIQNGKPIFTIEEHSAIGGLGSIVSEYIAESCMNPLFKRFSLPDQYSHFVGSQKHIREKFNFTSDKVVNDIIKLI